MFRTTVRADENTDVDQAINALREKCEGAGLPPVTTDLLTLQTHSILAPLVARGKEMATQGSRIQVTRDMVGDGYKVHLIFGAGGRKTILRGLIERIRGC